MILAQQTHLTFEQTERTALFLKFGFREVLVPQDEICCISNARLLRRSVLFFFMPLFTFFTPYFAG
jgi:positive regulator of sigma E activity